VRGTLAPSLRTLTECLGALAQDVSGVGRRRRRAPRGERHKEKQNSENIYVDKAKINTAKETNSEQKQPNKAREEHKGMTTKRQKRRTERRQEKNGTKTKKNKEGKADNKGIRLMIKKEKVNNNIRMLL